MSINQLIVSGTQSPNQFAQNNLVLKKWVCLLLRLTQLNSAKRHQPLSVGVLSADSVPQKLTCTSEQKKTTVLGATSHLMSLLQDVNK